MLEHSQAILFVNIFHHSETSRFWQGTASIEALRALLSRFIEPKRVAEIFIHYADQQGLTAKMTRQMGYLWILPRSS